MHNMNEKNNAASEMGKLSWQKRPDHYKTSEYMKKLAEKAVKARQDKLSTSDTCTTERSVI